MNKEIKFKIKLSVDGKEQLVTATTDVNDLTASVRKSDKALSSFFRGVKDFDKIGIAFQSIKAITNQLTSTLDKLTEESGNFGKAMNVANTRPAKGEKILND